MAKGAPEGVASANYSYTSPEGSFLFVNFLSPFYAFLVQFYPRWWHPNGITLFGIACTCTASYMLIQEFPNPSPPTLIIAGILNFVYCIADNTDGKQARRLGSSSPIGEYLDHGMDCVTSIISIWILLTMHQTSFLACPALALATANIVMSHLVSFMTGKFIWGNAYVSVDEGMIAFGALPIISAFYPNWFLTELPTPFGPVPLNMIIAGGFILGQVSLVHDYFTQLCVAPMHWSVVATMLSIWWVQFSLEISALSTQFVLPFALSASIIAHVAISSKCRKLHVLDNTQALLVLIVLTLPFKSQLTVAALAVAHALQIFYNIKKIYQSSASS